MVAWFEQQVDMSNIVKILSNSCKKQIFLYYANVLNNAELKHINKIHINLCIIVIIQFIYFASHIIHLFCITYM